MSDVVERIRERQADLDGTLFHFDSVIFKDAADEIESLRAALSAQAGERGEEDNSLSPRDALR